MRLDLDERGANELIGLLQFACNSMPDNDQAGRTTAVRMIMKVHDAMDAATATRMEPGAAAERQACPAVHSSYRRGAIELTVGTDGQVNFRCGKSESLSERDLLWWAQMIRGVAAEIQVDFPAESE
jgi:hypothetical protein